MAEIINQIPGYEKGRVQRITATDEVSESFIVAQIADDLRKKWNTSVLCISPDGLFREAFYNREIARKVVADLLDKISTRNC
jgi:hypothetical protein